MTGQKSAPTRPIPRTLAARAASLIARIGRYGNVDDADPKCGKIHPVWPRAVGVSDEALYVLDEGNWRLFPAALSYHVEAQAPIDGRFQH